MKLTKETLKRIIKEELNVVLKEANIMPDPSRTNIPSEQAMAKVISLIDSGKEDLINQARMFIDTYEGDQSWVDEYLDFKDQTGKLNSSTTDWFSSDVAGYGP